MIAAFSCFLKWGMHPWSCSCCNHSTVSDTRCLCVEVRGDRREVYRGKVPRASHRAGVPSVLVILNIMLPDLPQTPRSLPCSILCLCWLLHKPEIRIKIMNQTTKKIYYISRVSTQHFIKMLQRDEKANWIQMFDHLVLWFWVEWAKLN